MHPKIYSKVLYYSLTSGWSFASRLNLWATHMQVICLYILEMLYHLNQGIIDVALPTQGTWCSDNYIGAFRLVDILFFFGMSRWSYICIYWLVDTNMRDHAYHHIPSLPSHHHMYQLFTLRHWQLFLKVAKCQYSFVPFLSARLFIFADFTYSILLMIIQFR